MVTTNLYAKSLIEFSLTGAIQSRKNAKTSHYLLATWMECECECECDAEPDLRMFDPASVNAEE